MLVCTIGLEVMRALFCAVTLTDLQFFYVVKFSSDIPDFNFVIYSKFFGCYIDSQVIKCNAYSFIYIAVCM